MRLTNIFDDSITEYDSYNQKYFIAFYFVKSDKYFSLFNQILVDLRGCSHGLAVFRSVFWNFTVRKL